jgi:hypothetical protein
LDLYLELTRHGAVVENFSHLRARALGE